MPRSLVAAFTACLLVAFLLLSCSGPSTATQQAMSATDRRAIADSVVRLSRQVMEAGETLDVDAMTSWFRDDAGSAFGGASGLMLSTAELGRNLQATYGRLEGQDFDPSGQRVVVLAPDAAVVTGIGRFTSTDTLGNRGYGNQAYTFVWMRSGGGWGIVQAHFSSNLAGVDQPEGRGGP